jgi:hypothetical protein
MVVKFDARMLARSNKARKTLQWGHMQSPIVKRNTCAK